MDTFWKKYLRLCKEKKDSFLILDKNIYTLLYSLTNISLEKYLIALSLQSDERKTQYVNKKNTDLVFNHYLPFEEYVFFTNDSNIIIQRYLLSPFEEQFDESELISSSSVYKFFEISSDKTSETSSDKTSDTSFESDYIFPRNNQGYYFNHDNVLHLSDGRYELNINFSEKRLEISKKNENDVFQRIFLKTYLGESYYFRNYNLNLFKKIGLNLNILPDYKKYSKILFVLEEETFQKTFKEDIIYNDIIEINKNIVVNKINHELQVQNKKYKLVLDETNEYFQYCLEPVQIIRYKVYDLDKFVGYGWIHCINSHKNRYSKEIIQKKINILFRPLHRPKYISFMGDPENIESKIPSILALNLICFIIVILTIFFILFIIWCCQKETIKI